MKRSYLIGVPLLLLTACLGPLALRAETRTAYVEFNEAFLRSPVDVGMFAQGNPVAPGLHRIDLYMNGQWKGRAEVNFALTDADSKIARVCYDVKLLDALGLALTEIDEVMRRALMEGPQCMELGQIQPQASAVYDSGMQRLDATAAQAVLIRNARGYVSPEFWDEGITAAMLQYDYNAYRNRSSYGNEDSSQFLGLRGGFNLGPWRLRYRSSASWNNQDKWRYRNSAIYAERGLAAWRSKLTIGESTTGGQVFDSIGFRGVQLASQDLMYADSQRGFAPVIRGIANSNARVRVSQRGTPIYETTVPPGQFVIDDLYPNGSGGDLLVTITEANGSEHSFTVTYASTAELLRPGVTRYSLTAGQYRSPLVDDSPAMVVGTLRHGFSNMVTGYGGVMAARGYSAVAGGMALNTRVGALAADVTYARTSDGVGQTHNGYSVRLTYAKILPVIETNVTLASYRYSSQGYYDAAEAFQLRAGSRHRYSWMERRRNRFLISATQALPDGYGMFSLSGSTQNYWSRSGSDTEYMFSYNNHFKGVGVGASVSRNRNVTTGRWDNRFMLTFSIPLGDGGRSPQLNAIYVRERDANMMQAGISGSAGSDRQFRYNAFATVNRPSSGDSNRTAGVSGTWAAPYASVGASASTGSGYRQYGASLSGGIVAYSGGVVLSPSLGETIAIVEADYARGARFASSPGVRVDGDGLAVVPYLTPYRQNRIEIDPKGISTDVQLLSTSQRIAPTLGAVTLIRFETETGYSVLLSGQLPNGQPLPFAAGVFDAQGRNVGFVAQGGQTLLRVPEREGTLFVKWGGRAAQTCAIRYAFTEDEATDALGYRSLETNCVDTE